MHLEAHCLACAANAPLVNKHKKSLKALFPAPEPMPKMHFAALICKDLKSLQALPESIKAQVAHWPHSQATFEDLELLHEPVVSLRKGGCGA